MKPSGDSSVLQIVQRRFGNFVVFLRVPGRRIFFQKFVQETQRVSAFLNQLIGGARKGYQMDISTRRIGHATLILSGRR